MALKRVSELTANQRAIIYQRIKTGRLNKYQDEDGYCCYDDEELKAWKPKKRGRKVKLKE